MSEEKEDVINPSHYRMFPGLEAIDIIRRTLTREQYYGYLIASCLKYRLRAGNKGDPIEDLKKAQWFQDRANEDLG